jgi:AcrR family transcriptional regulator
MSSPSVPIGPRRQLSGRNQDTVDRLLDAAVAAVADVGYDALTVRTVARAAGVSAATAYTYFASKEHLLAAEFWRRIEALPPVVHQQRHTVATRVRRAVEPVALLVAEEPDLAGGVTTALLAHDPDVQVLRARIGDVMGQRIRDAVGDDAPPEVIAGLTMAFAGALLTAGLGVLGYRDLAGVLGAFAGRLELER